MSDIKTETVRVLRKFKTFDLVEQIWDWGNISPDDEPSRMEVYCSKEGHLIDCRHRKKRPGIVKAVARLEISPEPLDKKKGDRCAVGKSAVDGKWYGWSHRAMAGFGKGDRVFQERYARGKLCGSCKNNEDCEGEPCPSSTPFTRHGKEEIKTDADARKAAVNFSRYVS